MVIETLDNALDFLISAAKEVNPNADIRRGVPVYDFLIRPLSRILQPLFETIDDISRRQSILNSELLSDEDVDAIMANVFLDRRNGSRASGQVRIFFDSPIDFSLLAGSTFTSAEGLRFLTPNTQTITAAQMSLNVFGDLHFFDVNTEAETEGSEGEIGIDEIVNLVTNNPSVVQVTNITTFTNGVDRETNSDFITRGIQAITERSLVTSPGSTTIILDEFSFIRRMQPIGFGDPEMIRDILVGTNLNLGGISFEAAEEVNIGGKVDYYLQIDSSETKNFILETATIRNRLRSRDSIDGVPGVDESFHIQGGVLTNITFSSGTTILTDTNLAFTTNELVGKRVEFLDGKSRRQRFSILSNTSTTIILALEADASIGDSFFIINQITRPILEITQIEEIDPVTLTPLGNFLTEGQDYILEFEEPSLTLSDIERISILISEFGSTITSVSLDGFGNTIVTDSSLALVPSAFIGRILRLSNSGEEFTIVDNTATTFKILGNQTAILTVGADYVILGGPFLTSYFQVDYKTQANITQIQDFISSTQNRVVTADLLAKSALPVFVDLSVTVQSQKSTFTLNTAAIQEAVENYLVVDLGFKAVLEVSDIIDLIYDVTDAGRNELGISPFTFSTEHRSVDGVLIEDSNIVVKILNRTQVFSPRNITVIEV